MERLAISANQLSNNRALAVAACHIQYTFLSLRQFSVTRKRTKHENTRSRRR